MELTKVQYKKLDEWMPMAIKSAKVSNYKFMRTILYIKGNGCKWMVLQKGYGKWQTVYIKFNR